MLPELPFPGAQHKVQRLAVEIRRPLLEIILNQRPPSRICHGHLTQLRTGPFGIRLQQKWQPFASEEALLVIHMADPTDGLPRIEYGQCHQGYGQSFRSTVAAMGVEEVVTAPRSPWQNPYVERLIGSVRRECLDHSIILNERHLRRILGSYLDYYHGSRTHLSIGKDTPDGRSVQPAGSGTVVSLPKVGGLHHRYERLAA